MGFLWNHVSDAPFLLVYTIVFFLTGSEDIDSVNGVESSVTGVVIQNMIIRNAGQECVRLRYYVTASIVQDNIIENCGIEDFQLGSSGSNGEGICESRPISMAVGVSLPMGVRNSVMVKAAVHLLHKVVNFLFVSLVSLSPSLCDAW